MSHFSKDTSCFERIFSFSHWGIFPIGINQNIFSKLLGRGSIVDKEQSRRPSLEYLFGVSFLTTLDIYKTYFKGCHIRIQRPRGLFSLCEATAFVRHRVLQPSASRSSLLMKWRTLQPTTSNQVAGVSLILGIRAKG